jgi:hypothetical protein
MSSQDIQVQCTRCRNKHLQSARVEGKPDKFGLTPLICPRCGGHNVYKLDANEKPARAR